MSKSQMHSWLMSNSHWFQEQEQLFMSQPPGNQYKNHFLQEYTPTQRFCHYTKFPFKCNFWLWEGIPKQAQHFPPVRGFIYFDLKLLIIYDFRIFNLYVICSEGIPKPVLQTLHTLINKPLMEVVYMHIS